MEVSAEILSLGVILLGILLAPLISTKIKIPVLIVEVIYGIIIGKSFFNIVTEIEWFRFFSFFGLVYLLFLAGLEIEFEEIRRSIIPVMALATGSLVVPFTLGYLMGRIIQINPIFLGVILCTTSLGVVLPITKSLRQYKLLQILLGSTVLVDLVSMFLLVLTFEIFGGTLTYSYLLSISFFLAMFILPLIIGRLGIGSKIWNWSLQRSHFQFELRFCLGLIAIFVVLAELIGVHAILGAFLAGLIISELTDRGSDLEKKLLGIGYGFFVPFFFILIGINTNMPQIFGSMGGLFILVSIIFVGIFSKVIGVGIVSRILGFSSRESLALGFIQSARLSLVLAGIEIGRSIGLIDMAMYSIFVIFAIVSVLIAPSIGVSILRKRLEIVKSVSIPEEFWEPYHEDLI
ncbi:cation:proton antiporter [[Eubacterium] cellulosolvens]